MAGAASGAIGVAANQAIQEAAFLFGVRDEVEYLRQDWRSLQTFLSKQRGSGGDAITVESVHRIRDAANEAENIIDTADYRARRDSMRKGMLGAISRRKIQDIKSSRELLDAMNAGRHTRSQSSSPTPPAPRLAAYRRDDEASVLGLEGDVKVIDNWLRDCSVNPQLTVISIVAMGGAGKTTLARKVYKSDTVKKHFEAFAFVSISQQFEVLPVLKEIASQVLGTKKKDGELLDKIGIKKKDREFNKIEQEHGLDEKGEQALTELLHNILQGQRYLIVLDVWTTDTWEVLQHAFPDRKRGSRLIITTRDSKVAKQADKLTRVHEMRPLNEQESWKLFSLKAFPSYENIDANKRQELESVGRKLAQKCHGLPLTLVVLGCHLSKNLDFDTCLKWNAA